MPRLHIESIVRCELDHQLQATYLARELQQKGANQQGQDSKDTEAEDATPSEAAKQQCSKDRD
jgi:hypothetical protein